MPLGESPTSRRGSSEGPPGSTSVDGRHSSHQTPNGNRHRLAPPRASRQRAARHSAGWVRRSLGPTLPLSARHAIGRPGTFRPAPPLVWGIKPPQPGLLGPFRKVVNRPGPVGGAGQPAWSTAPPVGRPLRGGWRAGSIGQGVATRPGGSGPGVGRVFVSLSEWPHGLVIVVCATAALARFVSHVALIHECGECSRDVRSLAADAVSSAVLDTGPSCSSANRHPLHVDGWAPRLAVTGNTSGGRSRRERPRLLFVAGVQREHSRALRVGFPQRP